MTFLASYCSPSPSIPKTRAGVLRDRRRFTCRPQVEPLESRCLLDGYGLLARSIVAADPATGQVGIAVVSKATGVPAIVPVGEPGVAVADQAFPSYADAQAIIRDVGQGDSAATALTKALAGDPNAASRQFGVAALSPKSPTGVTVATFTGSALAPDAAGLTGPTYAVQANFPNSSAITTAMAAGFASASGSLPQRLLAAVKAGTPAANDQQGEFSASIRVFSASWALASVSPVSADSSVQRSANWQAELTFGLNAYLSQATPGDPADRVPLTDSRVNDILTVFTALGFYDGKIDGHWNGNAEKALENFSAVNLQFFIRSTVVQQGTRYIDGPLADYIVEGGARGVFRLASGAVAPSNLGTRSIVAADPATGQVGIAVVSFPTGTPGVVPVGEPGVIVTNHGFPRYATARAIVSGIEQGEDAPTALAQAVAGDPAPQFRQYAVAALNPRSPTGVSVATYTGSAAPPERSAVTGPTYAAVADIQTSPNVAGAMAAGFAAASGSLPRRLLTALLAGTSAGNDIRGEFSACIRVFSNTGTFADITPISAESSVDRARNWQDDLTFGLDAYLAFWTAGDPADLVPLTNQRAVEVLTVLTSLGYYQGELDGSWNGQAEKALKDFSQFNLALIRGTVVQQGVRFIDEPLAEYILLGAARGVLIPAPNSGEDAGQGGQGGGGNAGGAAPGLAGTGSLTGGGPGPRIAKRGSLVEVRGPQSSILSGWYYSGPWEDYPFANSGDQSQKDQLPVLTPRENHLLVSEHAEEGVAAKPRTTLTRRALSRGPDADTSGQARDALFTSLATDLAFADALFAVPKPRRHPR
jgi:uncharacterized Ntn-hydrolase superfamily protein